MKKPFCDICEEECEEKYPDSHINVPFGDFYNAPNDSSKGYETVQAQIVATMKFSFYRHRTGWAGPPDLCFRCKLEIIRMLLKKEEDFAIQFEKSKVKNNDQHNNSL